MSDRIDKAAKAKYFLVLMCGWIDTTCPNKELFENAPPYMIIEPTPKGCLYIGSGQISELIVKQTYIHMQLLTNPHEYYDKSVPYTVASLHKSI